MGLTDVKIRKTKPQDKRFELSDGKGLTLLILPSGTKSWVLRYQFEGKARRITLGRYPTLSLSAARNKASKTRDDINQNIDPQIKKNQIKEDSINASTFINIINELWDKELSLKKSGTETKRLLERDVVSVWGKRKIQDIKRRDIVLLLDKIEKRAPVTRNRVQGALSRLFNFAAERGVIEDSPCTRIKKLPEKSRKRVLSDKEIQKLWVALDIENKEFDVYRLTKLALKLVLLTGQRPGEVCGMRKDDVDSEGIWTTPAERMKNNEPHRLPLTVEILEILEIANSLSSDSAFVFRSSYKKEDAPLSVNTLSQALLRHREYLLASGEKYTTHDIRRTVRTRLAEIGVSDIVAERIMAHKMQGMMSVYNHHNYDAEKRTALENWSQNLKEITSQQRK